MGKIKVTLTGTKKDGYILTVFNKEEEWCDDIALQYDELVEIKKKLDKTLK